MLEHEHEHTHADGTTHSHAHTHADGAIETHTHTHADGTTETHTHTHAAASSPEEALALLKYMLDHNRHHAEELHELAHNFDELTAGLLHDAVDEMDEANSLIEQALSLLENE